MNLHLISMGFDVTHILSKIKDISPTKEDMFYFIRPVVNGDEQESLIKKKEMAEKAINSVFETLSSYVKVVYKFIDLDDTDFTGSILRLFDETILIDGKPFKGSIHIWAVGGTRSLVAILVLYGQIDPRVKRIYGFTERMADFPEIPTINKEYVYGKQKIKQIYNLLDSIERGLPIPPGVGNRIINKLIKDGLIVKRSGRRTRLEITDIGRIYKKRYQILINL